MVGSKRPQHPSRFGPADTPTVRCQLCPDKPGVAKVRFNTLSELAAHEAAIHGNEIKCARCGQRVTPGWVCSCVEPNAPPPPRPRPASHVWEMKPGAAPGRCLHCTEDKHNSLVHRRSTQELSTVPVGQWTDLEIAYYVAFVLDSAAHLAGGFGALTPRHCMAFAARLRRIGGNVPAAEEDDHG